MRRQCDGSRWFLRKDRYDNAVTEALLDAANEGKSLRYDRYLLPPARVVRAYSSLLNRFGKVEPVPEGMSAAAGLRNEWYTRMHTTIKKQLMEKAELFVKANGYVPPYWQLVEMARTALGNPY